MRLGTCQKTLLAAGFGAIASVASADAPSAEDAPPAKDSNQDVTPIGNAEALDIAGHQTRYTPFGFTPKLQLFGRVEGYDGFAVDRDGTEYDYNAAVNTQLRVGLSRDDRFGMVRVFTEYEHDFLTGTLTGGGDLEGVHVPDSGGYGEATLRKLWLSVSIGPFATIGAGFTTSHWGLGLLANDGAHGWTPGSAYFGDPRGGDRVLRALLASGPFTSQRVTVFAAFDAVRGDDVLFPGDNAIQAVAGVRVGDLAPIMGAPTTYEAGVYGVWRRQESDDDQVTEVGVIDVYGRHVHRFANGMALDIGFEGALIVGETALAPTLDAADSDVLQLGAKLQLGFDGGLGGANLDIIYASGDRNFDDEAQNGFKLDINSEVGLILFRQVLAAQTARSPITAANPDLVGLPNEDLDRLPTRGNVTNTVAFFPRGWIRPVDGLEIYAGVLFALSEVDYADAFNTRIAGGDPRNPVNGEPGMYFGTEIDAGIRFRGLLFGSEFTLGLEGGILLPGSALRDASGTTPGALLGGRAMAQYRF